MEEILASIRKIISEDTPESAPEIPSAAPPPPAEPEPVPAQPAVFDDVLELTQVVEAPPPPAPEPVPAPQPAPPPPQPEPEHDVVFEPVEPVAAANDIFSDHTRRAVDDVFAAIPEPDEAPAATRSAPIAPVDGATVETVFERAVRESFEPVLKGYLADNSAAVIERMKPLIREWMDEHFPALLEGAVRAEVERVVKARGAKR
jgi:cell pole-organizing protein PopZ